MHFSFLIYELNFFIHNGFAFTHAVPNDEHFNLETDGVCFWPHFHPYET